MRASTKGRGQKKSAPRRTVTRRGLKDEAKYRLLLDMVNSGETDWPELEAIGEVPKQPEKRERTSPKREEVRKKLEEYRRKTANSQVKKDS